MRTNVYRNLNKPPTTYSLQQRGKVIGYAQAVLLKNVRAKHPNDNQIRRVRSGPREVCAWISGEMLAHGESWEDLGIIDNLYWTKVDFDPKRHDKFPFDEAAFAKLDSTGMYIGN